MVSAERERVASDVLALAGRAALEAIVVDEDDSLTRFTQNAIHQNVARRKTFVRVRVVDDGRTGVAQGNDLAAGALRALVARAKDVAALSPRDDAFAGLTASAPVLAPPGAFAEDTASAGAAFRAGVAARLISHGERHGLWAAGYVRTGRHAVTIANTAGTRVSFDGTSCGLNVKENGADSSGFAEAYGTGLGALDAERAGEVATEKALRSAEPLSVEPGEWTVILEPPAFGELMAYVHDHFSAQAFDEGSSFLSDGLDRRYAGEAVTISEDHAHPLHAGMPFDWEGCPTQRFALLERGVARRVVTDSGWARRLGRENTGHALPEPNAQGPQVRGVVVAAGEKPLAQLIAETPRGLLISRFWYIRPVDHRRTIVTGMTRDGTFLIENGELGRGVRNLRFNQSILDALERAEFGDTLRRTDGYAYSSVVPAVKIDAFRFTSTTDF